MTTYLYRPFATQRFPVDDATADRIVALGEWVSRRPGVYVEIYAEDGEGGGLGLMGSVGLSVYWVIAAPALGSRWRLVGRHASPTTYRTVTGALRAGLKADGLLKRVAPAHETETLASELHRRREALPTEALADLEQALGERFGAGVHITPRGYAVRWIEDPDPDLSREEPCGVEVLRFAARHLRLREIRAA